MMWILDRHILLGPSIKDKFGTSYQAKELKESLFPLLSQHVVVVGKSVNGGGGGEGGDGHVSDGTI